MTFSKAKTIETMKRSMLAKGWRTFSTKKMLCMIPHVYKPIDCTTPRVNRNVNCGFWVTMMGQCRFIYCSKCVIWWGMLILARLWSGEMGSLCNYHTKKKKKIYEIHINIDEDQISKRWNALINEMEKIFKLQIEILY